MHVRWQRSAPKSSSMKPPVVGLSRRAGAGHRAHLRRRALQEPRQQVRDVRAAAGERAAAAERRVEEPAGALVAELHRLDVTDLAERARGDELARAKRPRVEAAREGDRAHERARGGGRGELARLAPRA